MPSKRREGGGCRAFSDPTKGRPAKCIFGVALTPEFIAYRSDDKGVAWKSFTPGREEQVTKPTDSVTPLARSDPNHAPNSRLYRRTRRCFRAQLNGPHAHARPSNQDQVRGPHTN